MSKWLKRYLEEGTQNSTDKTDRFNPDANMSVLSVPPQRLFDKTSFYSFEGSSLLNDLEERIVIGQPFVIFRLKGYRHGGRRAVRSGGFRQPRQRRADGLLVCWRQTPDQLAPFQSRIGIIVNALDDPFGQY